MAEYELVREIKNLCRNNQMRDIFFEEVECEDPESYVRNLLKGKELETNYMGERMLELLEDVDPEQAKNLKVSQIETKSNEKVSTAE